jgi:hypothetical protein
VVGAPRFELGTPCSQSMGAHSNTDRAVSPLSPAADDPRAAKEEEHRTEGDRGQRTRWAAGAAQAPDELALGGHEGHEDEEDDRPEDPEAGR